MTIPHPLACDAVVTHDPATKTVSVKVQGVGATFWRQGHRALVAFEEAGRYNAARDVRARGLGGRDLAWGEPVNGGWLRFKLSATDYRELVSTPDLGAIAVVDQQAGRILGVKFRGRP